MTVNARQRRIVAARDASPIDLLKRDMSLTYGGRAFTIRAYRDGSGPDGPGWHAVVVEHRTPLRHGGAPTPTAAGCFAEAVRFVAGLVDAPPGAAPVGG